MNPSSRTEPQNSTTGPRSTGGKAAPTQTPANAHLGQDKPGLFDAQGAVGKQFTSEPFLPLPFCCCLASSDSSSFFPLEG